MKNISIAILICSLIAGCKKNECPYIGTNSSHNYSGIAYLDTTLNRFKIIYSTSDEGNKGYFDYEKIVMPNVVNEVGTTVFEFNPNSPLYDTLLYPVLYEKHSSYGDLRQYLYHPDSSWVRIDSIDNKSKTIFGVYRMTFVIDSFAFDDIPDTHHGHWILGRLEAGFSVL